jgi:hypothetical protein
MSISAGANNDDLPRARTKSRPTRVVLVVTILVSLLVAFALLHRLESPDGVYYDPYIGCIGDAYWVYREGQVSLRTPEDNERFGNYTREGRQWVWRNDRGGTGQLVFRATIVGIKLPEQRFMFRRSFAWIPKSRDWIQMHCF